MKPYLSLISCIFLQIQFLFLVKRRANMPTRRSSCPRHGMSSMAVIMGFPIMTGMVMLMGLQFNGLVLVDMSLFVSLMGVGMFVLVGMRVRMLMGVGMAVLLLPVPVGMLMFMPVPVLMFMGVVVFAFHCNHLLSKFRSG